MRCWPTRWRIRRSRRRDEETAGSRKQTGRRCAFVTVERSATIAARWFCWRSHNVLMMRTRLLATWMGAVLLCLWGVPTIADAETLKRRWAGIDGLRLSNATLVTKDGRRDRGHLVISQTGVVVIHHGTYDKWLSTASSREIPRALVARILVRHRYRLTKDELDDLWWYVADDWKPIFYPEVSNPFPIAVVANAVFAGAAALYTPVAVIAAICRPPSSDIIEILPD
jgi:hypothetical protein